MTDLAFGVAHDRHFVILSSVFFVAGSAWDESAVVVTAAMNHACQVHACCGQAPARCWDRRGTCDGSQSREISVVNGEGSCLLHLGAEVTGQALLTLLVAMRLARQGLGCCIDPSAEACFLSNMTSNAVLITCSLNGHMTCAQRPWADECQ